MYRMASIILNKKVYQLMITLFLIGNYYNLKSKLNIILLEKNPILVKEKP